MQRAVYQLLHVHIIFKMLRGTVLRGVSKARQPFKRRVSTEAGQPFGAEWAEKVKENSGFLKGHSASVK